MSDRISRERKAKGRRVETATRNSRIRLSHGSLVELKKGHSYLICINQSLMTNSDMGQLGDAIGRMGFKAVLASFLGDPAEGVKVIEQKDDNSTVNPTPADAGDGGGLVGAGNTPQANPAN